MKKKLIYSILIGRAGSTGFPGKNLIKINNKYLFEYPIIATKNTHKVDKIYVSTDCKTIAKKAKKYDVNFINRPKYLADKKALGEDVFKHAYDKILKIENKKDDDFEFIILLFANGATVNKKLINKGISILRNNKKFDSAVTVSRYNMWSPLRARKVSKDGSLVPFVPFETFGDPMTLNCDRDSQGDVLFADMGVSIVRPHCIRDMKYNLLPQKWMGKKIAPIFSEAGFDIDYEWQFPSLNYWVNKYK
mgnify:CR=1 FL=1